MRRNRVSNSDAGNGSIGVNSKSGTKPSRSCSGATIDPSSWLEQETTSSRALRSHGPPIHIAPALSPSLRDARQRLDFGARRSAELPQLLDCPHVLFNESAKLRATDLAGAVGCQSLSHLLDQLAELRFAVSRYHGRLSADSARSWEYLTHQTLHPLHSPRAYHIIW